MASQDMKFEHTKDDELLAAMTAATPVLMQSLVDSQRDVLAASQHLVEETLGFAIKRLEAQRAFFADLTRARDPDAFTRLQLDFWNKATADYTGEIETVVHSVQDMVERLQPPKQAA